MPAPLDVPLETLRRRTSEKWNAAAAGVLPLWVAEMDVMLAPPVVRALHDAVALGDTGYASGTAYAEALAAFAADRWGWDTLDVGRSALVPDVMMGIVELLKLVTDPGDAVVVNPPVYPPFYAFVEHMDRRVAEAPLTPEGRLDFDALGTAFEGAAAYLLCNPHNPTGTVHTSAELERVAALAEAAGVRVVADEIHAPLVLPGARFTAYLSVPGAERGFSMLSASKGWNLPGLKAAVTVAGPAAGADLARMPEEVSHGPSHLGVIAHAEAFRAGGPWLDELLAGLDANRALLARLLAERLPAVRYRPGAATYLAWLDCSGLGLGLGLGASPGDGAARGNVHDVTGPAAFFLSEARVLLSSGAAFGTNGEHCVRLNFATSPAILTEAVDRMESAVSSAGPDQR
ncbi:MAG: MalY/PatB family protein [Acidimicrobiales bacterium]